MNYRLQDLSMYYVFIRVHLRFFWTLNLKRNGFLFHLVQSPSLKLEPNSSLNLFIRYQRNIPGPDFFIGKPPVHWALTWDLWQKQWREHQNYQKLVAVTGSGLVTPEFLGWYRLSQFISIGHQAGLGDFKCWSLKGQSSGESVSDIPRSLPAFNTMNHSLFLGWFFEMGLWLVRVCLGGQVPEGVSKGTGAQWRP